MPDGASGVFAGASGVPADILARLLVLLARLLVLLVCLLVLLVRLLVLLTRLLVLAPLHFCWPPKCWSADSFIGLSDTRLRPQPIGYGISDCVLFYSVLFYSILFYYFPKGGVWSLVFSSTEEIGRTTNFLIL